MSRFTEFIEAYKELEKECRNNGHEIKDLEEELTDERSDKLRMCRYFRNYIQHVNGYEKFLAVTPEMTSFIRSELENYKSRGDIAKNHCSKLSGYSCEPKDKIADVLVKISKAKTENILLIDKGDIKGTISVYELLKHNTKTAKVSEIKKTEKKYSEADYLTGMENISAGITVVRKDGKIIGVINL